MFSGKYYFLMNYVKIIFLEIEKNGPASSISEQADMYH